MELEDSSKATSEYLSATMGKYSQAVIDNNEVVATIGMRATNDPSEGTFATYTDILCNAGRINLQSASGVGQARYNKDFSRMHEQFITGRKAQKKVIGTCKEGTFHLLPIELQDSLLSMCKKMSLKTRTDFEVSLNRQREVRAEKMKIAQELKLKNAERDLIAACYYFKQYNSPWCWKSIEQAKRSYEKLKTKKDKLRNVKEQIQIRSLGLGWKKAHHPWSCKGHVFDPDE